MARFLYGITGGTLTVRREIPASGRAVLDAVGRTVLHPPFDLRLHDADRRHPLEGGTLTFSYLRLQMAGPMVDPAGSTLESVRFRMRLAQIHLPTLELSLAQSPGGTTVEVRADLDREVRMGVRWYLAPVAVVGGLMGGAAPALAPSGWTTSVGAWGLTTPMVVALGASAGGLLMVALFRWFCRKAIRWVDDGFETMLDAVAADVSPPAPPREPPAPR